MRRWLNSISKGQLQHHNSIAIAGGVGVCSPLSKCSHRWSSLQNQEQVCSSGKAQVSGPRQPFLAGRVVHDRCDLR